MFRLGAIQATRASGVR
ncbi:unnamed protein product [Priceomyces carsonii]|nr:unnamed protein product [Priceomyces carsonii]